MTFPEWCIQKHAETNHFYDGELPYGFHLKKVAGVAKRYRNLIPKITDSNDLNYDIIIFACFGHDLSEDARQTYNDIQFALAKYANITTVGYEAVGDIIKACTQWNGGEDRAERMPDWLYKLIRNTPGAVFVKLCDRIANVEHAIYMDSSHLKKHIKEYPEFIDHLQLENDSPYTPMIKHLGNLLGYETVFTE